MKNFIYTARDHSGATTRGSLKAADRSAALAELKSGGLVPITLEEGVLKSAHHFKSKKNALLLTGVAVVMLLGLWVVLRLPPQNIKELKPKIQLQKAVNVVSSNTIAKSNPAIVESPVVPPVPVPVQPVELAESSLPTPLRSVATPPEKKLTNLERPKNNRILVPGIRNGDTNAPNPYATFRTKSERLMSQMLSAQPGEKIIDVGYGRDFGPDFIASLDNTIEIYPTDTEEMAEHKKDVAWLKEEMRKMVADGQSPEEILTALREQHNEVADFRSDLARQLSILKAEGTAKQIEQFVSEANKMLEPYGVRPLAVNPAIINRRSQQ